jgi:hypothetical protein
MNDIKSNNTNNDNITTSSNRILSEQDLKKLAISRIRLFVIIISTSVVCGIIVSISGTEIRTIFSNLPETISAGFATSYSVLFLILQIKSRRRTGRRESSSRSPSSSLSSFSLSSLLVSSSYYELRVLVPFTIGLGLWLVAEVIYSYYQVGLKIEIPFPSIADPIFLAGYGFFTYSFYTILKYIKESIDRDVIIFGSVAVSISLAFILQLSIGVAQMIAPITDQVSNILSIIYPVLDGILFIPALAILWSIKSSPSIEEQLIYSHWLFISLFIILNTIADIGYGYNAIIGALNENQWIWDIIFNSAYITIAAALFWQLRYYQSFSKYIQIKEKNQSKIQHQEGQLQQ